MVRDVFQAGFFGTGLVATVWEIAYTLPNLLRNLLAEGALSQAFIPVYGDHLENSEDRARIVAGVVLTYLTIVLGLIVLLAVLTFPFILPIFFKELADSLLFIELSCILFIFIMTASLTALLMGISQARQHFTVPALSPIVLNLVFIIAFVIISYQALESEDRARQLAFFVIFGGFLQLVVQAIFVWKKGWAPHFNLDYTDPALKKILTLMAPAVLGAALFQINQLMDIYIAYWFIPIEKGAIPGLKYAHRLIQLPTGVIGVALSTAILPTLVRHLREGTGDCNAELTQAIRFSLFLTMPAALGLFFLGEDIINLLFRHAQFDADSVATTWTALKFFVLGVPFYSLNKIITSTYYAHKDTRTPVKVMIAMVALNLCMNLILVQYLAHGGIALSTAISSSLSVVLLAYFLKKKDLQIQLLDLGFFLLKIGPVWLLCAALLYLVNLSGLDVLKYAIEHSWQLPYFSQLKALALIKIVFCMAMVLGIYFLMARFYRLPELNTILSYLPGHKKNQSD